MTIWLLTVIDECETALDETAFEAHTTLAGAKQGAVDDAEYADGNSGTIVTIEWEDDGDGTLVGAANGAAYTIRELALNEAV